jgi:hypothetical protein
MRAYDTERERRASTGLLAHCWRLVGGLSAHCWRLVGGLLAHCWRIAGRVAGALRARVPGAALFSLRVSPFSGILDEKVPRERRDNLPP